MFSGVMEVTPEGEIMFVDFPAGTGVLACSCAIRAVLFAGVYGVTRSMRYQLKCEHDVASLVLIRVVRVLAVFRVLTGSIQPEQKLTDIGRYCCRSYQDKYELRYGENGSHFVASQE